MPILATWVWDTSEFGGFWRAPDGPLVNEDGNADMLLVKAGVIAEVRPGAFDAGLE